MKIKILVLILICLTSCPSVFASDDNTKDWYLSVYTCQATQKDFYELVTFQFADFNNSYLGALAAGKTLWAREKWAIEVEGQAVKHFGYQDHWEFNAVISFRWMRFPWDSALDKIGLKTSWALGEGLSYALDYPPLEVEELGYSKFLNYLMMEWAFDISEQPWQFFIRIHHRSGIYGLINNISGGMNFIGSGIRYNF